MLLPEEGKFYKANLHCHTILSDGEWTKERVKEEYQARGYSIVAYTDHRHYGWHPELMDENFIPLAAFEVDLNDTFPASGSFDRVKTYHLNLYDTNPAKHADFQAVQPPQNYGDKQGLNAYLEQMSAEGFLICYNHPYWSLQSYEDYKGLRNLFAMEIYNYGCELDGSYGYAPQSYDEMLRDGGKLFCLATDDNHDRYEIEDPRNDSFGGFTMLKLPELTYENVIKALQKGDFYCSGGPLIHELYIRDDSLHVVCDPVERITMVTQGRGASMRISKDGNNAFTEAVFPLRGDEGYIRIDCRDEKGQHAYSNAYFL